jgi:hypothetical protein
VSRERRRWQAEKEAARGANVAAPAAAPAENQQPLFEDVDATIVRGNEASTPNGMRIEGSDDVATTSGSGVVDDAVADAEDANTENVVASSPIVGAMEIDGAVAELAGGVVKEGITEAIADDEGAVASVHADDNAAAGTRVAELISGPVESSEQELPEPERITRWRATNASEALLLRSGRARLRVAAWCSMWGVGS